MVLNLRSRRVRRRSSALIGTLLLAASATAGWAQTRPVPVAPPAPTYADVADLVEASTVVAIVEVSSQAVVEPARAPGVVAGRARLYIEGRTMGLLWGRTGLGQDVNFLVDVPLLANGKPPKLKKVRLLIFANTVADRPGTLQLVAPNAYLPDTPETEQLTRAIVAADAAPGAPPRIRRVRDVMSVPGNLVGESETQLFVETQTGAPVSLTVVRRPGMAATWGVSWSEIVDQAAKPPAPNTLAWYRLACFLPRELPPTAYLQTDTPSRARADADYKLILDQLGPCTRTRR